MQSLFLRLGGESAIEAVMIRFYDKVLGDPSLAPFFSDMDMDAQIKKQIAFLSIAFGAATEYSGRDLRTAHARLVAKGLSGRHFDAIAVHLQTTLLELGVDEATVGEVLTIVGGTRSDVLNL